MYAEKESTVKGNEKNGNCLQRDRNEANLTIKTRGPRNKTTGSNCQCADL